MLTDPAADPAAPWAKDFKLIDRSVYVGSANDLADSEFQEITRCSCVSKNGEPICCNNKCYNYAVLSECVKCGITCQNRRIQQNKIANISVLETQSKGYGLFANEALKTGAYIREYIGEIISLDELMTRRAAMSTSKHMYAMEIKKDTFIDSTNIGSISRFINHSCEPNCTAEVWVVKNRLRVAITTTKDIAAMEELSFDYAWEVVDGRPVTVCHCGTPSCRGTI